MSKINRLIFVCLFTLCSCWNREATGIEKRFAWNRSHYNEKIIKNLSKYNTLKDLILNNLHTIIKYQDHNNRTDWVHEGCWDFTAGYGPIDISHVSPHIYSELDSLIQDLGPGMLENFTICEDGSLEFNIKYVMYDINDINILHGLTWNKVNDRDYGCDYSKDTLLSDKWVYKICLFEDHGW